MLDTGTIEAPVRRFDGIPRAAGLAAGAAALLGAIGWVLALGVDTDRAWRAYLFNWVYFTTLAQGGVILACTTVITKAIWARSTRRIALAPIAFLPIAFVLMFPIFVAGEHIFPWIEHRPPFEFKAAYLTMSFMVARNVIMMAALTVLSLLFAYWAVRPDAAVLNEGGHGRPVPFTGLLTRRWRGHEVEEVLSARRLSYLAPAVVVVWAIAFSFVAFDFIMSLEPEWFSTLFGPYVFMAGFLGAIALTSLLALVYRRTFGLDDVITPPNIHDLGKLTFAFVVFWGYLFWAQYIVIYYGQLPLEQSFVIHRFAEPFKWLSVTVLMMLFVAPFFLLLGVLPKKTPKFFGAVTLVILIGLWLERYLLVYPSYYHDAGVGVPFGFPELSGLLLFGGIFLLAILWFAASFPIVQLWEPLWEPELEERPDVGVTAT
ncbi:MAG: hypothetical protein ACRELV_08965 [Longimicrobiales bacterium]